MTTTYTKKEVISMVEEYLQLGKINELHSKGFVNYRGTTSDTKEKYTEVIASHLLEQLERLKLIDPVKRTDSYNVPRDGTTPREADGRKWEQEEQRIAMKLFNKTLQPFSEILHYQTPLGDGRGAAIDLLARDTDSVYILELKRPKSKETLLRCVLEVHAYFCMLDHEKLLRDFEIKNNLALRKGVLIFKNSRAYTDFSDHKIRLLMRELKIDFFVLNENADEILETHYFNEI
ncbi:MAG: hypothetical protein GX992_04715 [Clostridium sp.]|nr:hypothetical protein [Clostridium sp.]